MVTFVYGAVQLSADHNSIKLFVSMSPVVQLLLFHRNSTKEKRFITVSGAVTSSCSTTEPIGFKL